MPGSNGQYKSLSILEQSNQVNEDQLLDNQTEKVDNTYTVMA